MEVYSMDIAAKINELNGIQLEPSPIRRLSFSHIKGSGGFFCFFLLLFSFHPFIPYPIGSMYGIYGNIYHHLP